MLRSLSRICGTDFQHIGVKLEIGDMVWCNTETEPE
jgi:hypothetical protein